MKHRNSWLSALIVIVICIAAALIFLRDSASRDMTSSNEKRNATYFNKQAHSLSSPSSPWVVVNKKRQLQPPSYEPELATPKVPLRLDGTNSEMQVAKQAVPAVEKLVAGARKSELSLMLASAYRSYGLQTTVYNTEVANYGQAQADKQSARPGHSEHQTGLAVDFGPTSRECEIQTCFGNLPEGKWIAANAYKYGFILRYQKGKEAITGYNYEPWHLRYVGTDLSTEMHKKRITTLEEFFGLPAAASY